jgi:hypothetical protein
MNFLPIEALGCGLAMCAGETGMPPNSGLELPDYCLERAHHLSMPDRNRNIVSITLRPLPYRLCSSGTYPLYYTTLDRAQAAAVYQAQLLECRLQGAGQGRACGWAPAGPGAAAGAQDRGPGPQPIVRPGRRSRQRQWVRRAWPGVPDRLSDASTKARSDLHAAPQTSSGQK